MSIIAEVSSIARAIDIDTKYGTIIGKGAAEYGITTYDLAQEISHKINEMSASEAIRAANWYFEANAFAQELAVKYNTTIEIVSGVISAVSPRMPWLRNKSVAETILREMGNVASLSAIDAATELKLGLSTNITMAVKIARGANISETLTGIKRRSFYNNIVAPASDCDSVTVDTWMMNSYSNVTGKSKSEALDFIRANEKALKGTGVGYFLIADATRIVADEMNLKPHQIQAIYWVHEAKDFNGGRTAIKG